MKRSILLAISIFLFISNSVYSQETVYAKGKEYEGYIFPKEQSIWGFPSEKRRYTPSSEDIAQAEKILQDSINSNYMKQNQKQYKKPPINKRTLNKYMRQYVGYLTDNNEFVIWINLFKKGNIGNQDPVIDIIYSQDGGYNFWSIRINITTKELSDIRINGIS
jgi:hypothetical protein